MSLKQDLSFFAPTFFESQAVPIKSEPSQAKAPFREFSEPSQAVLALGVWLELAPDASSLAFSAVDAHITQTSPYQIDSIQIHITLNPTPYISHSASFNFDTEESLNVSCSFHHLRPFYSCQLM